MVYLIIVVSLLWISVSHLCVNSFNDFCACDDEWDEMPLWVHCRSWSLHRYSMYFGAVEAVVCTMFSVVFMPIRSVSLTLAFVSVSFFPVVLALNTYPSHCGRR